MQNIEAFQHALKAYGVPAEDLFQTVDLWEKRNIPAVTKTIYALARTVSEFLVCAIPAGFSEASVLLSHANGVIIVGFSSPAVTLDLKYSLVHCLYIYNTN